MAIAKREIPSLFLRHTTLASQASLGTNYGGFLPSGDGRPHGSAHSVSPPAPITGVFLFLMSRPGLFWPCATLRYSAFPGTTPDGCLCGGIGMLTGYTRRVPLMV